MWFNRARRQSAKSLPVEAVHPWDLRVTQSADESGKYTSVVAPVLIAFTMPTVALIATSKDWPPPSYDDSWRVATLSLFTASSGCFLAGVQLIDGDLVPRWLSVSTAEVRAVLTYLGLTFLGGALGMLVLPSMRRTPYAPSVVRWAADRWTVSLLVLGLGIAVPILLRVRQWWITRRRRARAGPPRQLRRRARSPRPRP